MNLQAAAIDAIAATNSLCAKNALNGLLFARGAIYL